MYTCIYVYATIIIIMIIIMIIIIIIIISNIIINYIYIYEYDIQSILYRYWILQLLKASREPGQLTPLAP